MRRVLCFHAPEESNGYLSNWYPSAFSGGRVRFSSMEQYMMYQKAVRFQDGETAEAILAAADPGKIKALGQAVRHYDDAVWAGVRQVIVCQGLLEKFGQNEDLLRRLLDTGDCILAECAAQDRVWGVGRSMKDPLRLDIRSWQGQNLLGFTLMLVREKFRSF